MEFLFQLLDVDYVTIGSKTVVRLFGKCDDGKTACLFVNDYQPYFYVQPLDSKEDLLKFLNEKFKPQIIKIEEVEKYLPHCYMKDKSKIIKVTTNDPKNVPLMRDEIWKEGLAKKIFEADVLFKYRYMADKDLHGTRWYKVVGNPINTSTVKTNRKVDLVSMEPAGERPGVFKTMAFDIEIATDEGIPDSKKDPIIMISLAFSPTHSDMESLVLVAKPVKQAKGVLSFQNEEEMLKEFLKILERYDPDIAVGYNSNNFDIPYIIDRLRENNIDQILGRSNKPSYYRNIAGTTKSFIPGRILVDDYVMIKEMQVKTQLADKGFPKLKRYSLDDVSKALLNESKVDVSHKEIPKLWAGTEEDVTRLIDYARQDSILAIRLLLKKNLLDKFFELSKVSGLLMQDTLDGGEATRVENMLLRAFNKRDFVLSLKPSSNEMKKRMEERDTLGFKGALVLEPETGLHTKPIVYLDFKSMYPTIFISFNVCPTTLITKESNYSGSRIETPIGSNFVSTETRIGVIPEIVQYLVNERDRLRKEAKETKDDNIRKILESKQIAVKYMTNSFYGYTGYTRAKTYDLRVATAITACGRMLIERTNKTVSKHNDMKVVYGDTDSVMVEIDAKTPEEAFKRGQELETEINKVLEGLVTIKIENVFSTLLILSKKRYAGISIEPKGDGWEEKNVMKGIETVRRDWCDLTGSTLSRVLDIILREKDPKKALSYVKDVITDLSKGNVPIEKLVITKSISKSLKQYKGVMPHVEVMKKMQKRDMATAPVVGDRVQYVITAGTQLTSLRAEDPAYVKANNMKIDSRYYIENQLVPPLERVFDAIGITKSEILNAGRLTSLMSFTKANEVKEKKSLSNAQGVVCDKCGQTFRRPPMMGKCESCGGKLSFYSGEEKSKLTVSN